MLTTLAPHATEDTPEYSARLTLRKREPPDRIRRDTARRIWKSAEPARHAAPGSRIPPDIVLPARYDAADRQALYEMAATLNSETRASLFGRHRGPIYQHSEYERALLASMFDDA